MHPRRMIASCCAALVSAVAVPALCTETVTTIDTSTGYIYQFKDDLVGAGGLDAKAARLRVVRHAVRDPLIRPRLSFVPELLKTVENL